MNANQNSENLFGIRPDASNCDNCRTKGTRFTSPGAGECPLRVVLSRGGGYVPPTENTILMRAIKARFDVDYVDAGVRLTCSGPLQEVPICRRRGSATIYTDDNHKVKIARLNAEYGREDYPLHGLMVE